MESLDYDIHSDNSPDSYGIVFIDFKDKEIYSVQDYDSPGFLLIGEMLINSYKNNPNQRHLVDLYKNDHLFVLDHNTEDYIPMKAFLKDKNLLSEMDDLLLNNKKTDYSTLVDLNIDNFTHHILKEWSIFSLNNLPISYVDIMDNMLSKGIVFNPSELASWKDFALEAADLDDSIPDDMESEDYVDHLIKNVISKHKPKPLDETARFYHIK